MGRQTNGDKNLDESIQEFAYDSIDSGTISISNLPRNANLEIEEILWNAEVGAGLPVIKYFENLREFKNFVLDNCRNDDFSVRLFHSSNPEYFDYNELAKDVLMNAQFKETN